MASGALPPGFPPIEIEGEHYWDGGLVSNTPLQWVVDSEPRRDTLAFQVDLWSARGEFPRDMFEFVTREKGNPVFQPHPRRHRSIQTRPGTATRGCRAARIEDLRNSPEAKLLSTAADRKLYIAHLIYRAKDYEGHSKDYEFSLLSMEEHWRASYHDAPRTLRHREVLERDVFTFDLAEDGRERQTNRGGSHAFRRKSFNEKGGCWWPGSVGDVQWR